MSPIDQLCDGQSRDHSDTEHGKNLIDNYNQIYLLSILCCYRTLR